MSRPEPWDDRRARAALLEIFHTAVNSAAPGTAVLANLPPKPRGRCIVVGAGKASAAMAAALDNAWPDVDLSGVVSTRYDHAVPAGRIRIIEAGHPVPDANSVLAAELMLDCVRNLSENDLVVALISGGGSASLAAPMDGLSLEQKRQITRQLLASGATISEMNTVRTHLSRIKGGKLSLAAYPAQIRTLIISDVPGDDPALVASGPTILTASDPADAATIMTRFDIDIPNAVSAAWSQTRRTRECDPRNEVRVIASAAMALDAASRQAEALGFQAICLGDDLEGESRDVAASMAARAVRAQQTRAPGSPPIVLLSGGETTVTVNGDSEGKGGRNCEFQLALAIALEGAEGIWSLAGDSDGIDGTEDAAGAIVAPDSLHRSRLAACDAHDALRKHDSYTFFQSLDDLVMTGPTLTNVNDIRIILVT